MHLKFFFSLSWAKRWSFLFFLCSISPSCGETPAVKNSSLKLSTKSLSPQEAMIFFSAVTDRVRREYVEPVSNEKLLEGAIHGMLASLDPHSAYLTPKQYQDIKKQTLSSKYGGLGIEMMMEEGLIRVISAIADTPADKAGIQSGDYIIMINDEPVIGLSAVEASEKLRGEPNTTVKLTLQRQKLNPFDVEVKREDINIKPVDWRLEDTIGYIRIKTFNKETAEALHKSINDIKSKMGSKLVGYVIDLRNNPGGLLEPAIAVADTFLHQGEILSVRGRESKDRTKFEATAGDKTEGLPLVVLINGGTASSSEIVAGALQDNHRAIILGTTSFGKGSIQNVIPLTNGGAMKMTTAAFYTPSGRSIQKQGIIPDVKVEQHVDLKTIQEEGRLRESNFSSAIDFNRLKDPTETSKETAVKAKDIQEESQKPSPVKSPLALSRKDILKPLKDYQLEEALNIVKVQKLLSDRKQMAKSQNRSFF